MRLPQHLLYIVPPNAVEPLITSRSALVVALAIYGQSESCTCVYCGLLNTQGNVLVVAIVCNNGYYYPLGRACAFSTYRTGFTECSCWRMHLMYSNDHL